MARHSTQDVKNAQWLNLSENEEVVWWGHPSLVPMLPIMAAGAVAAIAGLVGTIMYFNTAGFWPLLAIPLGIILIVFEYLNYITKFYVVTNQKVVKKVGIIRRDAIDVHYDDIEHSRALQNIQERILGYGDIEIATAGTAIPEMYFNNVTEPKRVSGYIEEGKSEGEVKSR